MDLRILEIASNTENHKVIKNYTHQSKNKNPICGDVMEISLIVKNDLIEDIGYQCKSCVYCQASVSMLSNNIKNKKIKEIKNFLSSIDSFFEDIEIKVEKNWVGFKEILNKKNISRKECLLLPFRTVSKGTKVLNMIKISKENILKAAIAGLLSAITIGVLTLLTYKTTLGLFLAASFGSSMVLLYGFPESPFAQPKNIFFGHLLTSFIGILFLNYISLPIFINLALAVGFGIFFMIIFNVVHPPAGGNPIIVIIGGVSFEYLINPIIFGCLIILLFGIILNKFILKKKYPLK